MRIFSNIILVVSTICFLNSNAFASGGSHFGFAVGTGAPYLSHGSLLYVGSPKFSADISYNALSLTSGLASVSLTKPELNLRWHPFAGAFYLGVGVGQMTLEATATDTVTGETAKVEVSALTATPNLGWMWGIGGGGLIFGLDIGYQNPMSPETTITTILPTTDQAYIDAEDQGQKLGETAFPTFSIRLGYLF